MKEIIIGTANFNNYYGINKNKIFFKELKYNLLVYLRKKKINFFDSSLDYNLNKNFLKSLNFKNSRIITKFSLPKKNKLRFLENLQDSINSNKKQFKIKIFEAILLHNIKDLKSKYNKKIIEILFNLKKNKHTKKIGVSIYSPSDLELVFKHFRPDFIQAPINIFDKRLISSKWMKIIRKNKISIQARSIFLQGLLVMNIKKIEQKKINKRLLNKIKHFELWCINNKISRLEACLQFVKNLNHIDYLTIGVESKKNLSEILSNYKKSKKVNLKDFSTKNTKLIDPRLW